MTRQTFTTPDDLARKVTTSLAPWLLKHALNHLGDRPANPAEADFTPYLEDLVDRTDHINISGIATRHAEGAHRTRSKSSTRRFRAGAPSSGRRTIRLLLCDTRGWTCRSCCQPVIGC